MANSHSSTPTLLVFLLLSLVVGMASAQLSSTFYDKSCPKALSTIKAAVVSAVKKEARMGASLLRLHFHDCFVQASHLISLTSSFFFLFLLPNQYLIYKCLHALSCVCVSACSDCLPK
jgi:hypothetical protein